MDRHLGTMLREIARTTADTESRVSQHRAAFNDSSYRLRPRRMTSTSIRWRVAGRRKVAA